MKKIIFILFVTLLIFSVAIGGCTSEVKSPKEKSEEGADQESVTTETSEFILKYNEFCPESYPPSVVAKNAAQRIEEQSGGRLKLDMYFSESLLPYPDTYSGTASGVADITMIATPNLQGIHDLNTIFELLFETEAPDRESVTAVFRELLEKYPQFQEELAAKGTRWLDIFAMDGYQLHTVDKLVKVPEDLRGLKIAADGLNSILVNSLNAAAVNLAIQDYYMSLERGLVYGQVEMLPSLEANNLVPLFKHHLIFGENIEAGLCTRGYGWLINLKTWESLPEDLQKILVENFRLAGDELNAHDAESRKRVIAEATERGNTITFLSPKERELWVKYMKPINEELIEKCEKKGYPAREIVNEMWRLFEKYK